jgi:hypothetical protein
MAYGGLCRALFLCVHSPLTSNYPSLNQELLRKESTKGSGGFSLTFLAVAGLLGIIIGYILKKT